MKIVYQCSFCKHIEASQRDMEKHETKCLSNPKNKACASCDYRMHAHEQLKFHEESGVTKCIINRYNADFENFGACPDHVKELPF